MSEIVYGVAPLFELRRTQADLVTECASYGAAGFLPLKKKKKIAY